MGIPRIMWAFPVKKKTPSSLPLEWVDISSMASQLDAAAQLWFGDMAQPIDPPSLCNSETLLQWASEQAQYHCPPYFYLAWSAYEARVSHLQPLTPPHFSYVLNQSLHSNILSFIKSRRRKNTSLWWKAKNKVIAWLEVGERSICIFTHSIGWYINIIFNNQYY